MKKFLVVLCAILLFTGCSCAATGKTPDETVDSFFEKYRNKDDDIITQLVETIKNEDLTDETQKEYRKLMEKQYDQLSYVIKDTKEDNNEATVTVELTVLNYRGAVLKAEEELNSNPDKFNDEEGNFSEKKYMEYKIEKMKDVTDTTTYTIDLNLTKENGMWKVDQLSSDDISKIHGLY